MNNTNGRGDYLQQKAFANRSIKGFFLVGASIARPHKYHKPFSGD